MGNLELVSFTKDEKASAMAISWRPGQQGRLKSNRAGDGISCDLRYQFDGFLPNGMLFIPRAMEDKWVIAWRDGAVVFARSWSGDTQITADATVENSELRLTRIYADASIAGFGDVATVVDWIIRSHAMGERLPLPVDQETADMLVGAPLMAMSVFGHRLFCAGLGYQLPPADGRLHSDGDIAAAVHSNDVDQVRAIASEDAWKSRTSVGGAPPLVLASQLGYTALCKTMLELGADIEACNDRGGTALQMGVVGKAGLEHIAMLIDAGADLAAANLDGFTPVHASVEIDDAEMLRFLAEKGVDLEAQTVAGFRPIHIAAGLGHLASAETLVDSGVDIRAAVDGKTAIQIARSEGKVEFARWFESLE